MPILVRHENSNGGMKLKPPKMVSSLERYIDLSRWCFLRQHQPKYSWIDFKGSSFTGYLNV